MEHIKKYWYVYIALFVFFMLYKPVFCFLILGLMIFVLALNCFSFIDYINKEGIKTNGKIVKYKLDNEGKKLQLLNLKP